MRRIFVLLLMFFFILPRVFGQALPVTPMQNAVSGVMQQTMIKRGFAANDPRFGATLSKASTALGSVAGTAAAVTVGAVTAPGWASIALAAGIGAVVTYAVTLGIDSLTKWLFRQDGSVDEQIAGLDPVSVSGTATGQIVWCTTQGAGGNCSSTFDSSARQAAQELVSPQTAYSSFVSLSCTSTSATSVSCSTKFVLKTNGSTANGPILYVNQQNGAYNCPTGQFYRGSSCMPFTWAATSSNATAVPLNTAVGHISETDKTKPLNPAIVAALADQAWKNAAAQPGYDGLPYVASNPITASDAAKWQQANPQSWPSVNDFVKPQPSPTGGTSASPYVLPNTATPVSSYNPATQSQSTSTNPASSNTLQNLGPDPGIGSPSLEATPTAQSILAPILGLLPDLRSFSAPSQSGVCPKPTIDLWNKHLVLDGHCALLDNNAGAIQAVMALVWVLIAMFIILAA